MATQNHLLEALAKSRSRSSWNARLAHWEKPASDTEEAQIERAASMVRDALASSNWLSSEGVTIAPQGSCFNNTNIRQNVDQDLRAVHGTIRVECAAGIDWSTATGYLGTRDSGRTFASIANQMRTEIDNALGRKFGALSLDTTGNKATRVLALPGSRAPVDVVPCFRYFWVMHDGPGRITHNEGISILSKNGSWTNNFPNQHHENGIVKSSQTQHRFKKMVRSLKRIRDELVDHNLIGSRQAPSFLIECLTYAVEDTHFLTTAADERYDRLLQIVERMDDLLADPERVRNAMEINGIKYLFHASQPWTADGVRHFIRATHTRLLDT